MSKEAQSWALYGHGLIGTELERQVSQPEVAARLGLLPQPDFIATGSRGYLTASGEAYDGIPPTPQVAFVAIPSDSDGSAALNIIRPVLEARGRVVTAEKGAMANHFDELRTLSDGFARLGVDATVGGGTHMMSVAGLYLRDPSNVTQIHMTLNGTLTAILSEIGPQAGDGVPLGQAVANAVRLGFAEPGAESPADVIAGEASGDLPKKTAIFMSKLGLVNRAVRWDEFNFEISPEQLRLVEEQARVRRPIVSLYHTAVADVGPETDIIGGFDTQIDGWRAVAGFRDATRNSLFSSLLGLTGAGNGMVIGLGPNESDGVIRLAGQGAGVGPTVNTMLDDFLAIAER